MSFIPKPHEIYKHFNGNLYQITAIAEHTETGETLVVYQAMYGDFKTYARPLAMFISPVDREKYPDAEQEFRFELQGPEAARQKAGMSGYSPAGNAYSGMESMPEQTAESGSDGRKQAASVLSGQGIWEQSGHKPMGYGGVSEQSASGEVPQAQSMPGKAPRDQAISGEAPQVQVLSGEAPQTQILSGEAPQVQTLSGKAPQAQTLSGKAPQAQTLSGKAPQAQAVSGKAPREQSASGEVPQDQLLSGKVSQAQASSGKIPQEQLPAADEEAEEFHIDPLVLEFLDADSYEERLNILAGLHHRITDDMITTMAIACDVEIEDGDIEERYESLKTCLLTMERYECNRIR